MFFWFSPTDVSYFVPLLLFFAFIVPSVLFPCPSFFESSDCAWCIYWCVWCPSRPATLRPLRLHNEIQCNNRFLVQNCPELQHHLICHVSLLFVCLFFISFRASSPSSSSFFGFVFQMTVSLLVSGILSFLSLPLNLIPVHSCLSSLVSQLEGHQRKRSKRENLSIHFLTSSVSLVVRMQVLPPLVLLLSTFHV